MKTNCAQLCSLVFQIYGDKDKRVLAIGRYQGPAQLLPVPSLLRACS